jgi:dCTP diphosphatase
MSDAKTTLQELKDLVARFRDERDWKQFHNAKDLAEAGVIEAGELLELFLWKDKETIARELKENPKFRSDVEDELADVLNFALLFADITGIDLAEACRNKVKKNNIKYPVEKVRGSPKKYTEYQ